MWDLLTAVFKRKYLTFVSANPWTRFKLFLHALWYFPLLFFSTLILIITTFLLEVLEPIVKVRIKRMPSDRIGTLTPLVDLYLRRLALNGRSKRELHLMFSGKPINLQLMTMIKRRLHVLEHPFLLKLYKLARILMRNSKVWGELSGNVNNCPKEFNLVSPQLSFIEEEKLKGRNELLRMGMEPSDSFVCFHSRDKAYLDRIHPHYSREEWAYHDHRDSDIRNFLPAAEYLASLRLFVIRMGYIVGRPIETSNPRIIDYATGYRSDFMDVYLSGNCKFFLGTNAGLNCVAQAFGVPVAAVNWIPLRPRLPCKDELFIPKKLWSIEKKRFLTFREIITLGVDNCDFSEEYTRAGIEVVENTADEILALVKEMNARLDNEWVAAEEDEELQERYNSLFPPHYYPDGVSSRIGAEFLRQNRELLE